MAVRMLAPYYEHASTSNARLLMLLSMRQARFTVQLIMERRAACTSPAVSITPVTLLRMDVMAPNGNL